MGQVPKRHRCRLGAWVYRAGLGHERLLFVVLRCFVQLKGKRMMVNKCDPVKGEVNDL